MSENSSNKPGLIIFLLGVAVGLLIAPKPGNETREIVRQVVASGLEKARSLREEGVGE